MYESNQEILCGKQSSCSSEVDPNHVKSKSYHEENDEKYSWSKGYIDVSFHARENFRNSHIHPVSNEVKVGW